jgi:hypothetical protein
MNLLISPCRAATSRNGSQRTTAITATSYWRTCVTSIMIIPKSLDIKLRASRILEWMFQG